MSKKKTVTNTTENDCLTADSEKNSSLDDLIRFDSEEEKDAFTIGRILSDIYSDGVAYSNLENGSVAALNDFLSSIQRGISLLSQPSANEEDQSSVKLSILENIYRLLSQPTIKLWDWICLMSGDFFTTTPLDPLFYGDGLINVHPYISGTPFHSSNINNCLNILLTDMVFCPLTACLYKTNRAKPGVKTEDVIWNGKYFLAQGQNAHQAIFNLKFCTAELWRLFATNSSPLKKPILYKGVDYFLLSSDASLDITLMDLYLDQIRTISGQNLGNPPQIGKLDCNYFQQHHSELETAQKLPLDKRYEEIRKLLSYANGRPRLYEDPNASCLESLTELGYTQKLPQMKEWSRLPSCSRITIEGKCFLIKKYQRLWPKLSDMPTEKREKYEACVEFLNTHRTKQALFNLVQPSSFTEWRIIGNYVFSPKYKKERQPFGCVVDPKFRLAEGNVY